MRLLKDIPVQISRSAKISYPLYKVSQNVCRANVGAPTMLDSGKMTYAWIWLGFLLNPLLCRSHIKLQAGPGHPQNDVCTMVSSST
jgi:hypothetical protein